MIRNVVFLFLFFFSFLIFADFSTTYDEYSFGPSQGYEVNGVETIKTSNSYFFSIGQQISPSGLYRVLFNSNGTVLDDLYPTLAIVGTTIIPNDIVKIPNTTDDYLIVGDRIYSRFVAGTGVVTTYYIYVEKVRITSSNTIQTLWTQSLDGINYQRSSKSIDIDGSSVYIGGWRGSQFASKYSIAYKATLSTNSLGSLQTVYSGPGSLTSTSFLERINWEDGNLYVAGGKSSMVVYPPSTTYYSFVKKLDGTTFEEVWDSDRAGMMSTSYVAKVNDFLLDSGDQNVYSANYLGSSSPHAYYIQYLSYPSYCNSYYNWQYKYFYKMLRYDDGEFFFVGQTNTTSDQKAYIMKTDYTSCNTNPYETSKSFSEYSEFKGIIDIGSNYYLLSGTVDDNGTDKIYVVIIDYN